MPNAENDVPQGCPVIVWDGPYRHRCGLGATVGRCARHGPFPIRCAICHEPIIRGSREHDWTHRHGDAYCGTGDGSTAYPPGVIPPGELVEPNTELARNSGRPIPPGEGEVSGRG